MTGERTGKWPTKHGARVDIPIPEPDGTGEGFQGWVKKLRVNNQVNVSTVFHSIGGSIRAAEVRYYFQRLVKLKEGGVQIQMRTKKSKRGDNEPNFTQDIDPVHTRVEGKTLFVIKQIGKNTIVVEMAKK